jgi:uncharacterized protein (TIGR00730 family)
VRRLCVFCGSNIGRRPGYAGATQALGSILVERGIGLVYGGGSVGLMGLLADTVLAHGGEVVGVIPWSLVRREVGRRGLSDLIVVDTMHERKARMAELADAFLALPGGIGTLEEFFEIWSWAQLGIHSKACGLLNTEGYFDPLLQLFEHMVDEQFVSPQYRALIAVESEPRALLDLLLQHKPGPTHAWLKRSDL